MIHVSKLLRGGSHPGDAIRYGGDAKSAPVVVWHMTGGCNLKCAHCYADTTEARSAPEMSEHESTEFLESLAEIQPPVLLFSGGEPLWGGAFENRLRLARKLGLRVAISTNGTLIDERAAGLIADCEAAYVGVSIDGGREANDSFRGVPGAFDAAVAGVKNLMRAGCRVGLRFTMAGPQLASLGDVMNLASELGVDRICFYHHVPSGRGGAELTPSRGEVRLALAEIFDWADSGESPSEVLTVGNFADGILLCLRLKERSDPRAESALRTLRRGQGARSGRGIVSVRWDGSLFADQFSWDEKLGSWKDIASLPNRHEPDLPGGRCGRCKWLQLCRGNMRVRARMAAGGPGGEDPGCHLTEDEISA